MKPPEKIWLDMEEWNKKAGADDYYYINKTPLSGSPEYHLAPVWHDAVKEPPKNGEYWVKEKGSENCFACTKTFDGWWTWNEGYQEREYHDVEMYYPLPLPPERSGE
jgi:hypothetical protein